MDNTIKPDVYIFDEKFSESLNYQIFLIDMLMNSEVCLVVDLYVYFFYLHIVIDLLDYNFFQPNLVASHRMYMSKVDVTELSDSCSGRGDTLTLFLFNDVLEVSVVYFRLFMKVITTHVDK